MKLALSSSNSWRLHTLAQIEGLVKTGLGRGQQREEARGLDWSELGWGNHGDEQGMGTGIRPGNGAGSRDVCCVLC